MNQLLTNLIEALREELKQYGEMLALLDHQQQRVMHRQTDDLLPSVAGVEAQADAVHAARREREQHQRHAARRLELSETAGFGELVPLLPADYQPLIRALVQENNELLIRVQQRARQNHLLLSRAVELMQRFMSSLCPGSSPKTCDDAGRTSAPSLPRHPQCDTAG